MLLASKLNGQEIVDGTLEISIKERALRQDVKKYDDEDEDYDQDEDDDVVRARTIVEVSEENRTPPPQYPIMLAEKSGGLSAVELDRYAIGTQSGTIKISP